jgi:hypothetical protein
VVTRGKLARTLPPPVARPGGEDMYPCVSARASSRAEGDTD